MNYRKIYFSLISKAKARPLNGYTEKHHIIPRSIFKYQIAHEALVPVPGENHQDNLVNLTAREHAIVHRLLVKIFARIDSNCYQSMLYAANLMGARTSKQYQWLKERYSSMMSQQRLGKPSGASGKKWSEESKQNRKKSHYMTGKTYEEIYGIEKANELKQSRKQSSSNISEELRLIKRKKISDTKKKKSEAETSAWKAKISASKKGKSLTVDHRASIKAQFSNPDTHPSVDQTLFKFKHSDGREVIARKYDMKRMHQCPLPHKLISGERRLSGGWELVCVVLPELFDS